jgi:hypothetical protein
MDKDANKRSDERGNQKNVPLPERDKGKPTPQSDHPSGGGGRRDEKGNY